MTPARRIYIDIGWLGDDGGDPEAMGLHHEFSSLLMKRYPHVPRADARTALNPPGFTDCFGASTAANLSSGLLDLAGDASHWPHPVVSRDRREKTRAYGADSLVVAGTSRWPRLRYPIAQ